MRPILTLLTIFLLLNSSHCFTKDIFNSVKSSLKSTADSLKSSVDSVKTTFTDIVGHIHNSLCNHDDKDNDIIDSFTVESVTKGPKTLDDKDEMMYDIDVRGSFKDKRDVIVRNVRILQHVAMTTVNPLVKQIITAPDRCRDGTVFVAGKCRRLFD